MPVSCPVPGAKRRGGSAPVATPRACAGCARCAPGSGGSSGTSAARSRARQASKVAFATALDCAEKLLAQEPGDKGKLYALHAPEVECIGKGKARTRYEFGVKASFAVTNARCKGGQFVLGARTLPGNPYDGHSLAAQIAQTERLSGRPVARIYADRGYRGHGVERAGLEVTLCHTRGIASPTIRREMRRRNAIEPVIGHMKADGLLERNHLAGPDGDAINALLCAAGHNLRLLARWLRLLWLSILGAMLALSASAAPAHERTALGEAIFRGKSQGTTGLSIPRPTNQQNSRL